MRGIGRNALGTIDALVCFGPGVDRNGTLIAGRRRGLWFLQSRSEGCW
jgi:hypothetical protein